MKKETTKTKDPMANAPSYVKQGEQNIPAPDSAMPFPVLKLLQQLSPELDKDDQKYLPGASAGDIIVTDGTTTTIIDGEKGISFSPMIVRKIWTEWIPRQKGGGFVATYKTKEEAEAGFTVGNELNISIDYLIVSPDLAVNGVMTPTLLQLNTPTKMAVAREMQKYITQYKTMYGVNYLLKCKKQVNKAGQKFYNFSVTPQGWTDKRVYACIEGLVEEKGNMFLPAPGVKEEF